MNEIVSSFQTASQNHISHLREELKGIRTGRAQSGMLENITIEAYGGTKMRLIELATIAAESSSSLIIIPFDPSTVPDIERGILSSPIGVSPKTEGNRIIVQVPQLSEEQRLKFVKLVSQLIEETKNQIRRERDTVRKKIKTMEDDKSLSEDERYRNEKEVDELTTKLNDDLSQIKSQKELDIMAV